VFEIPSEPPLVVDRQLYRVHALTDRKSPSHWDGEGPRGPGTHRSYQRLVPGSLVVSSTDGSTVYRPDVDYIYDYYWGSIKPATGGAIQPNTDVAIAYKCYRCRYDTIAIDPNGKASIVRGESMPPDPTELLLPYPPAIPESSLRLGNIFTGWTNNKITEGSIGDFVPDSQNESSSEATPLEAGGRYDDILPRDYLVEIEEPGPVGVATYRVAATGDPYGVDPPRSLDDPVFGSSIRTSTQEATPLSFPVNDGRTADYSLRIDFRPMGGTVLAKGDRWTLRAEPRMIFNRDASPPELFPNNEIEGQRKKIQKTLERLEQGEKVRVVFLGESTTSGGYWPTLFAKGLQDLYPRATVEAFNVGIGGENILGGLPRLEQDVFSKDPDLVIVEYLINDSGVNFRHDDSEGPGPVETSHRELLQKIQDHGGIEVVYLTANMGNPAFVQAYTFENFRRTSDLYHSLCEEFGCAYVDSFRVWENMGEAMGQYFITRLKGNMVNHPFGNQDIAWSADETNSEWLLKLFQPKE
ncbi:MAG: hypothetical protein KC978_16675, partial [Candidatus Omnitrophica bacterium]|nr:hypothetical protein [Candidatus Omnitrophota bacterium]